MTTHAHRAALTGHARWKHPDGRATTIPVHGNNEIGGWLFYEILKQLGISEEEFRKAAGINVIVQRLALERPPDGINSALD